MGRVTIFTTGGTIEKSYDEHDGSIGNRESLIRNKVLARLRLPHVEVTVREIMAKDSLDMTPADRETIRAAIAGALADSSPVLVLHGTDTMEVTAAYCRERMPAPAHAVVFTGAMKPAGFDDSDAMQNFIEGLFACQVSPPGYYICFHGRRFEVPHVTKDRAAGTFVVAG